MPPTMLWLTTVVRLTIVPEFLGALFFLVEPARSLRDLAAAVSLVLLGAIRALYWWRPWPSRQRCAVAAAASMVLTNVVLLHVLNLSEPLLWPHSALIAGVGLRPLPAATVVALMSVAAGVPVEIESMHVVSILGSGHAILLAVVLAGLGMTAVRQLMALNADLHATRAELVELAVASSRERLSRELHDLLGRTLALIAVKAELASRLSAKGDPSAGLELGDVQHLARQAVRDVREAIAGDHAPSVDVEFAAAEAALRRPVSRSASTMPPRVLIRRTRPQSPGRCARR